MRHSSLLRLLVLLAMLMPASSWAQADDQHLKVAAFNLENLYDVFDDPYTKDEETDVKSRAEVERIAATLRRIDADVIGIVEVENEGILRGLVNGFLGGMGYDYITVPQGNSTRGINLGVISRKPIVSITSHRFQELTLPGENNTWRFARDLLQVKVQATPQQTMDVFVVHFKSRHDSSGDPQSRKWRLAESTRARQIIAGMLKQDAKAWVAIIGDFNDTPETDSLVNFLQPKDGSTALVDCHAHLPADKRITYLHEPYRSTIDYILVSPALGKRVVTQTTYVLNEPDWRGGSDHAPVIATFDLK
jgi:predicted extracellular nuclease